MKLLKNFLGPVLLVSFLLGGCSAENQDVSGGKQQLIDLTRINGIWFDTRDSSKSITLNEDGSLPEGFRIDGERAISWKMDDDGDILFTMAEKGLYDTAVQTDDEQLALENDHYYYLQGDRLILDRTEYSRTQQQAAVQEREDEVTLYRSWKDPVTSDIMTISENGLVNGILFYDDDMVLSISYGEDDSLILNMRMKNQDQPTITVYPAATEEEALKNNSLYYLSSSVFVLDGVAYGVEKSEQNGNTL